MKTDGKPLEGTGQLAASSEAQAKPKRGPGRPFVKGKSGNPKGRSTEFERFTDGARALAKRAMTKLDAQLDHDDPYVAQGAAKEILNRAWGKSPQPFTGEGGEGSPEVDMGALLLARFTKLAEPK